MTADERPSEGPVRRLPPTVEDYERLEADLAAARKENADLLKVHFEWLEFDGQRERELKATREREKECEAALVAAREREKMLREEIRQLLVLAPALDPDNALESGLVIAFRHQRGPAEDRPWSVPEHYPAIGAILTQEDGDGRWGVEAAVRGT